MPPPVNPGEEHPGQAFCFGSGFGCRGGNSTADTLHRNPSTLPPCRGCSPVSGSGACSGVSEPSTPPPLPGVFLHRGTLPRCPLPIRETPSGQVQRLFTLSGNPSGVPAPSGLLAFRPYAPCPRPPVVSVPGLGGTPPGRFPGTLPGCKPGGVPVLSNCTGRKEPGKPGTRPPGGYSPIGGGCLSAGREGTRPGSWFPVPPLPGEFVRKPGLSFHPLPPCFRFAPEPVSQRFRGYLYPGGGCFPSQLSMFAGVPVTVRFIREPRPGLPRGRCRGGTPGTVILS